MKNTKINQKVKHVDYLAKCTIFRVLSDFIYFPLDGLLLSVYLINKSKKKKKLKLIRCVAAGNNNFYLFNRKH